MNAPQDAVLFHGGDFWFLSNFAATRVIWEDVDWDTSEHAYQAAKFIDKELCESIRVARSAREAKRLARSYAAYVRDDWNEVRLGIMESIVRAKVAQHPFIAERLMKTQGREIIEDAPNDAFWGRGHDWQGENHLGKILMKIRDELCADTFVP